MMRRLRAGCQRKSFPAFTQGQLLECYNLRKANKLNTTQASEIRAAQKRTLLAGRRRRSSKSAKFKLNFQAKKSRTMMISCKQFLLLIVLLAALERSQCVRTSQRQDSSQAAEERNRATALEGLGPRREPAGSSAAANQTNSRESNRNQFKYHLNHLRPPSLVPITIQQILSAPRAPDGDSPREETGGQSLERRAAADLLQASSSHAAAANELLASRSDLLQLQLPLQLHLKLRPLPLPLPPPPEPQPAIAEAGSAPIEKRRRSLEEPAGSGAAGAHPALSWQETKRALLMGALEGGPGESALSLPLASHFEGPAHNHRLLSGLESAETSSAATPTTSTPTPTSTATLETASSTTSPTREVRRQRHSSQQNQQGQREQETAELVSDSRFQAMAAAMLPLFWPSFQLSGSAPSSSKQSARKSSTARELASLSAAGERQTGWSLEYAEPKPALGNSTEQPQASELVANHAEPLKSSETESLEQAALRRAQTGAGSKPPRRKRRRPTYLTPAAALGNPYPDSTRLASKYPMPKIKLKAKQEVAPETSSPVARLMAATSSPTTSTSVTPPTGSVPKQSSKSLQLSKKQIPSGLSRLIERQLQMNATSLLMEHKRQVNLTSLGMAPPSTSVRRVVRPKPAKAADSKRLLQREPKKRTREKSSREPERKWAPLQTSSSTTPSTASLAATTTTGGELERARTEPSLPEISTTTTGAPSTTTSASPTTTGSRWQQLAELTSTKAPPKTSSPNAQDVEVVTVSAEVSARPHEEERSSTTSLPPPETSSTSRPKRLFGAGSGKKASSANERANSLSPSRRDIKLFHFKRKPDMKKLPFYRKPLNYTELGWSAAQIQEHLEATNLLFGGGNPNAAEQTDEEFEQPKESRDQAEGNLLRRRRRGGRNQFERLMAELHKPQPTKPPEAAADEEGPARELVIDRSESSEDLVPTMRKKEEPFVLKPMFFVMNQKRQRVPAASVNESLGWLPAGSGSTEPPSEQEVSANRSKPIVRMRRKHNGADQPLLMLRPDKQRHQWQPSRPFWPEGSSAIVLSQESKSLLPVNKWQPGGEQAERIMLVPSGLLTPSGSHLVPLYAPGGSISGWSPSGEAVRSEQAAAELGWLSARPATLSWSAEGKPSGGLAPSGDEAFLLAPAQAGLDSPAQPSKLAAGKQTGAKANNSSLTSNKSAESNEGLRVPKLLSKPARPAKYSLNGYIPKPSLSQQQLISLAGQPNSPGLQQPDGQTSKLLNQSATSNANANHKQRAAKLKPHQQLALSSLTGANGKDLDSSTSNEIFSRRRGLQQHYRSAAANNQPTSFDSLLASFANSNSPDNNISQNQTNQLKLKQTTDENKRRFLAKQQQLELANRSPTLSAQKVSQIKAKLGLTPTLGNRSSSSSSPTAASSSKSISISSPLNTNRKQSTSISEPSNNSDRLSSELEGGSSPFAGNSKGNLLAGAPLNSIPKTDFECTDRKGRFVSGLFADHKTGCQVWHLCSNNRKYSFLCPSGTIFNEKVRICDWRYNVKCEPNNSIF